MPQVGAWLVAAWQGAHGALAAFAVKTAASIALNAAVSKLTAPKGPRPQDLTTEARSSNAQRYRHQGTVRASGAVMFWDWANVGNKRRLFKLLAVADGGMQGVSQWYLDGEPVSVNASGYVTTAPWNKGNIRLRFRKGIQSDQWDGGDWVDLRSAFPGQWTADHRLRGVGTILAEFDAVGGEDIAEVYSGGEPEVSALISGAPSWWPVSNSYAADTRNAAIHFADLLTAPGYGPLANSDMALSSLTTARNRCADTVPTKTGTRFRYLSGNSYALSDPVKDTAQRLLDAMGGRAWINTEGKIAVQAGVWVAPTITILEKHVVEMDYGAGTERISRVTTLVPTYVAPEVYWQETNADAVEDTAAIALWGEGEPKSVDLLAVQHHGQAAHLCKQQLAKMNPKRRMTVTLRAFGLRLIDQQVVAVNIPRLGLNSTPFWIDSFGWDGSNVTVELIEADPASFNWTAAEEGTAPATPPAIDRGTAVRTTAITSVVVITNDGPPYIRIEGTAQAQEGDFLMAQYRRTSGGSWTDMGSEVASGGNFAFRTPPLADLTEYDVRVFFGRYHNGSSGRELRIYSTPVEVLGIDVLANGDAPALPVIVSQSGAAGGTLNVTFMPDLGANYRRTGLYRAAAGGSFGSAAFIKWAYDTATDVTMTATIPATGARFWLQSENQSQVKSDPVVVGNYPA